jgi:peptide subunit release factor RF-3
MGSPQSTPFELLRCTHCGDVIGVYEPLIVRVGDDVRETSRAADPEVPVPAAEHFHRDCFTALKRAGKN